MNDNQDNTSGLYKHIDALGKGVAFLAAFLGTPALFEATKRPLFSYFAKTWGREIAWYLTWGMGAVEAYLIYTSVVFLFPVLVIWATTKLAMRNFRK